MQVPKYIPLALWILLAIFCSSIATPSSLELENQSRNLRDELYTIDSALKSALSALEKYQKSRVDPIGLSRRKVCQASKSALECGWRTSVGTADLRWEMENFEILARLHQHEKVAEIMNRLCQSGFTFWERPPSSREDLRSPENERVRAVVERCHEAHTRCFSQVGGVTRPFMDLLHFSDVFLDRCNSPDVQLVRRNAVASLCFDIHRVEKAREFLYKVFHDLDFYRRFIRIFIQVYGLMPGIGRVTEEPHATTAPTDVDSKAPGKRQRLLSSFSRNPNTGKKKALCRLLSPFTEGISFEEAWNKSGRNCFKGGDFQEAARCLSFMPAS